MEFSRYTRTWLFCLGMVLTVSAALGQDYHCDSCTVQGIGVYHASGSTIEVGPSSHPLVLVCSNYDSTVWIVDNPHAVSIRLVILYGIEGAGIKGIGDAPILRRTFPSGTAVYEYRGAGYADLETFVTQTVGKGFTRFQSSFFAAPFTTSDPGPIPYASCQVVGASVYGANQGRDVNLLLGAAQAPLVLLLTAYEQITWNILNPSRAAIKEIWVSGYYPGEVKTEGDSIPVLRYYPRTKLLASAETLTGKSLAHYVVADRTDSLFLQPPSISVEQDRVEKGQREAMGKAGMKVHAAGTYQIRFSRKMEGALASSSSDLERLYTAEGRETAARRTAQ